MVLQSLRLERGNSANTTLYGFYKPWKKLFGGKIMAIRHVFKPTISFSYAPDFTSSRYGYTKSYEKVLADGTSQAVRYSPYAGNLYGYPSGTKQGMITMSVSNNIEMKVKSDRDTTGCARFHSSTSSREPSRTTWRLKNSRGVRLTCASDSS